MPHRRVLTHEVRKVKTGGSKQIRFLYQTFCLMTFPCRIPWEKFYSYLSQPDSIRFLWVLFDESPNPLGEGVMKWGVERIHTQSPHTPPQCPAMPHANLSYLAGPAALHNHCHPEVSRTGMDRILPSRLAQGS